MPEATSLAAVIKEHFGVETELIPGSNGVFDVTVDGQLIFSKHEVYRFPEHEEIIVALRQL